MRKPLMALVPVLVALIGLIGLGPVPAYANDSDRDVIICAGGAGYSGSTWSLFSSLGGTSPADSKCVMASADDGVFPISLQLSGTGTFSCGAGILSGTGGTTNFFSPPTGSEPTYGLTWQVTFSNGVGAVVGTATADCSGENGAECGQVKALGGYIVVIDGSPIPGQCNDSLGNSQALLLLTISA